MATSTQVSAEALSSARMNACPSSLFAPVLARRAEKWGPVFGNSDAPIKAMDDSRTDKPAHFIDITGDVCPMTFVKTKLLLERMPPGTVATVRLRGAEPLDNVPRAVAAHGHEVLALVPESGGDNVPPREPHILTIRRK